MLLRSITKHVNNQNWFAVNTPTVRSPRRRPGFVLMFLQINSRFLNPQKELSLLQSTRVINLHADAPRRTPSSDGASGKRGLS